MIGKDTASRTGKGFQYTPCGSDDSVILTRLVHTTATSHLVLAWHVMPTPVRTTQTSQDTRTEQLVPLAAALAHLHVSSQLSFLMSLQTLFI